MEDADRGGYHETPFNEFTDRLSNWISDRLEPASILDYGKVNLMQNRYELRRFLETNAKRHAKCMEEMRIQAALEKRKEESSEESSSESESSSYESSSQEASSKVTPASGKEGSSTVKKEKRKKKKRDPNRSPRDVSPASDEVNPSEAIGNTVNEFGGLGMEELPDITGVQKISATSSILDQLTKSHEPEMRDMPITGPGVHAPLAVE